MDKGYYKQYFDFERNHWWFLARADILRSYIGGKISGKKVKILNVGAATGASSEWLAKYGDVTSLEYDGDCVAFVKETIGLDFVQGSILELPFGSESFDVVCCFDVLEHIEDDKAGAAELQRVCKTGGTVYATVPAGMHLWSDHDKINHHYRRYDIKQFKALFTGLGTINFVSYFNARLYRLIYGARKVLNLKNKIFPPKKIRSDFESIKPGVTSKLFYNLMSGEKKKLMQGKAFNKGVSIFIEWSK